MNNSFLRYALVLTLIALASGVSLGFFNGLTAEKIEENRRAREAAAVQAVLDTDQFSVKEVDGRKFYLANSGSLIAFNSAPAGFGGPISLMVSLDLSSERVYKVIVVEHTETPGLGAKISEAGFTQQFSEKALNEGFKVKEDVQAVTGATISSRAVAAGIKIDAEKVIALAKAGGLDE